TTQAGQLGMHYTTLYRKLKTAGYNSGRKTRADKGSSSVDVGTLELFACIQKFAIRNYGIVTLNAPLAVAIAKNNGVEISVTSGQVNRLLKARKMGTAQQKQDRPHIHMRALYPNHVHEVVPALCIVYYLRGKQHMMADDAFYKNKLDNYAKILFKVWRYVLYDRASSMIIPWYVESAGESQENLADFLLFAWSKQKGRAFHGVPRILLWDKGSANTSAAIKSMLDGLEVEHLTHQAGSPRVKGGVEGANNIVETHFECLLRFEPVTNIAALNSAANAWANAYNANLIPHYDSRLRRIGLVKPMPRLDLWLRISDAQLRTLPAENICRQLMQGKQETRVIAADLTVKYKHPCLSNSVTYCLNEVEGICVGDKIAIKPLVFGDEGHIAITVGHYNGESTLHHIAPVLDFDQYGQHLNGAIIGQTFTSHRDTVTDTAAKALDKAAYGDMDIIDIKKAKAKQAKPYANFNDGAGIKTHSLLNGIQLPSYLLRTGTEIKPSNVITESELSLNTTQAAQRVRSAMGTAYHREYLRYLKQHYATGINESQLAVLIEQFLQHPLTIPIIQEA
ncbi:MAG: transposase family protein, partial [Oceanospirillaceae bacterium]|nr:transposase family protein [Oceanospirillaceae bacterium]